MRLTPSNKDNFRLITIGLVFGIAVASILIAVLQGQSTSERIRSELSERSQSIAAALGSTQVTKLAGTETDSKLSTYKTLKSQLASVKRANPDARSIYLMGRHNGQPFFYVDSEQPGSRDYSSAGEEYSDGTPADTAIFDNGKPLVEGPTSDSYGTFISGLAPIYQPGSSRVAAVIGIDVGAETYWRDIIYAALLPLLTGFTTILIVMVFESIRRRNMQLLALRSELVSVASHELRNPITGIRWAADSLQKMTNDERALRMAKAIYNSAVSLQASTDDILELSHAMNSRALDITPVDLTKLMRDIISVQELSAQKKDVTLQLDASWPEALLIDCDADQMKRVLHNVVSNSIKYTRDHTTVLMSYNQTNNMHELIIRDQGIGIPADEQAKVWRGFYRASNAVASNVQGTGLGLYLVKAVLERHGGNVRFVSEENHGTTFILSLPRHR
jgi:signal transduction histidine kinase